MVFVTPRYPTRHIFSIPESGVSSKGCTFTLAKAQVTRMSIPPNRSTTLATASSTCARCDTSHSMPIASVPRLSHSPAAAAAVRASMSRIAIHAPSDANAQAMPRPMP